MLLLQVLGIERSAGDEEVKKAKRQKSLATHPDKLGAGAVGANEAIRVVTQVRAGPGFRVYRLGVTTTSL